LERLQSCLEKYIANVTTNNVLRDEKYDARWAMMFEKQEVMIGLLDERCGQEEEGGLSSLDCQHIYDGRRGEDVAQDAVRPHLARNAVTTGELYTPGELQSIADVGYTRGTFYLGGG
jgi:hypothetical protein